MKVKAYFDRKKGLFTLNVDGEEVFKQLPVRSGQRGYENTDWVRSKSPCPRGKWLLWLTPRDVGHLPKGREVGEFYPISSGEFDMNTIYEPGPHPVGVHLNLRQEVGAHPENDYPGSIGCIVFLWDTPARKVKMLALFAYLKALKKKGLAYIEIEVF